jgi:hypothetical protein
MILSRMGMKGPEIVALIKEKRPGALTNDTFREYLMGP